MALDRFPKERLALAQLEGKKRLEAILDSPNPKALVRSLPAQDLFFTIQEVGPGDAGELVALSSSSQFRTFVDLDAWQGYELAPGRVMDWLRLAREGGDESFMEKLRALDIEVQELLVRSIVRIVDLEEDGEPDEDFLGPVERTPEGRFLIVFPPEGPDYALAKRLIDELYADDPFVAGRFLYAIRWELESELTDTALRWRNARLADLGFPSPEEAASLYARVDLSAPLPPPAGVPEEAPGFYLAPRDADHLLARAMARLGPERQRSVELELLAVLNAALVADSIPPADTPAVRATIESVHQTLSLGLEHFVGSDEARAAELLDRTAVKRIFQIGFTRVLELRWRADRMRRALPLEIERGSFLPDGALRLRLEALFQRRPRYLDPQEKMRAFGALEEVDETAAALDEIEAVAAAFRDAGFELDRAREVVVEAWGEAGLARVRFSDFFLTRLARTLVGLDASWEPLPADRLADAARAAFDPSGKLLPSLREAALGLLEIPAFVETALGRLEEELGPQVAGSGFDHLDPRFAAPWIVR